MSIERILEKSRPFSKVGVTICSFIFLAFSTNSKAEICNNSKAIEQYNTAILVPNIGQKLELLQQAATACSATYEILLELGDTYFENQQLDYAINTYFRTLNRSISDSQTKQANVFMRLMYA